MQPLLDAIRAQPDEDGPRLVYADWLTEQSDPYGEFIHVQCALERAPWWDDKVGPLQLRAAELLNDHRAEWEPKLTTPGRFGWAFSRGFPSRVEAPATDLVAAAAELIETVPTIKTAVALRFDVHPELFLSSPLLPRLNAVSLHYLPQPPPTREVVLRVLLDDPRFQHVRRLCISYTYLNLVEWEAIAGSALLPRLEVLDMGLGNATDESLETLMRAESSLRSLSVANCRVGTAGARAIANTSHANRLEDLDLSWNRVGVKGARVLAESDHLGRLQHLDLSHCQIGDDGCEAIANGKLKSLRALRLDHSRITAKGTHALEQLTQLKWIGVKNNALQPEAIDALKARIARVSY